VKKKFNQSIILQKNRRPDNIFTINLKNMKISNIRLC